MSWRLASWDLSMKFITQPTADHADFQSMHAGHNITNYFARLARVPRRALNVLHSTGTNRQFHTTFRLMLES
eukprot:1148829-Pelagomonas_calceolata.AAC.3